MRGGVWFFLRCATGVESRPQIPRRCEMAGYLYGGTTPPLIQARNTLRAFFIPRTPSVGGGFRFYLKGVAAGTCFKAAVLRPEVLRQNCRVALLVDFGVLVFYQDIMSTDIFYNVPDPILLYRYLAICQFPKKKAHSVINIEKERRSKSCSSL